MKRTAMTLMAAGLAMTGCGGDSESDAAGGDVEAFCDILRDAEAGNEVDLSEDPEAALAQFREFRNAAPSELRDDVDVFIDTFEQLEALDTDGNDEEAFGAALALMFNPKFIAATENVEAFGVEQCGLEPSSDDDFSFDDADDVTDGPVEATPNADGLITEAANVPNPLFDPFFDDAVDPNEASYEGAQYFLDVNYTDAAWRTRLGSWSFGGGDVVDFGVGGLDITESEAQEICAAVVEYLAPFGDDGGIAVGTYAQENDGTFSEETEVLTGTVTAGC